MRPGGGTSDQPKATFVAPESTAASESTAVASSPTAATAPETATAAVSAPSPGTPGAPTATPSNVSTGEAAGSPLPVAEGSTATTLAPTSETSSTPASTSSPEPQQLVPTPSAPQHRSQASRQKRGPEGQSTQFSTAARTDHEAVTAKVVSPGGPQAGSSGPSAMVESVPESPIPTAAAATPAAQATVGGTSIPTPAAVSVGAVLISSPDHSVYWALESSGTIFRSADRRSWQKQDSGVQSDLLAGQASSNTECWVVGRNGTILLTTDGVRWQRILSPIAADVVSVRAVSADVADIVAADGSRFSTFDRGSNWQRTE